MTAEKLSITLPRDTAEMIRRKVEAGDYASNSELVRNALRLWQEREGLRERKLAWLRAKLARRTAERPQPVGCCGGGLR